MVTDPRDADLIAAIQEGLPLCQRPYAQIAERLGLDEETVLQRVNSLVNEGTIKRLGVVVRHRSLGYRANAMIVWDIPDADVDRIGEAMGNCGGVTLCYRRPRRLPQWRFNLFCMIHGRHEDTVRARVEEIAATLGIEDIPRQILFSKRCFKQTGARYRRLLKSEDHGSH